MLVTFFLSFVKVITLIAITLSIECRVLGALFVSCCFGTALFVLKSDEDKA